jgi:hypothetical protein
MTTIEFIEDNTGELAQQALDDGYQAVEVAIGEDGVKTLVEAHNKAQARIRELEAARELWRKSEQGTLAQLAEANERFEGALSTIRELETQIAGLKVQLSEEYRDWMKDQCNEGCDYGMRMYLEAKARAESAHKAKRIAEGEQLKAAAELDEANARAEAMRGTLAQIIKRTEGCSPLVATDVRQIAQAALAPTLAEPPQVFPWKEGDMLRAELEGKK